MLASAAGLTLPLTVAGAAHQHHAGHALDDARLQHQRQRDVGERANRHERDLAGMLHHQVDDELRGRARVGRGGRLGQIDAAQPVLAVDESWPARSKAICSGWCAPWATGMSSRPANSSRRSAFWRRQVGVDIAKGRRQPDDLQFRRASAKRIAIASSMPGSVSMMIFCAIALLDLHCKR
jgi:hypothetical protein